MAVAGRGSARARNLGASARSAVLSARRYWPAYVLVLPAVVWRLTFTLAPLVQSIWFSLTSKSLVQEGVFVGLKNYIGMFQDPLLTESVQFTLIYAAAATILEAALGLAFAVLLNQKLRGQWLATFAMMLPWAIAPMLAGVMWKLMLYEEGGVLNEIVVRLGFARVHWLSHPRTAKISVIMVAVWKSVSWVTLIFVGGLRSLSREVLEAAQVDGAGRWQRFWYVSFPLLRSTMLLVLMLRGMGEVQAFEQIYGMTRGGPGSATRTIALSAYERFFTELRYGYGSAINMVLLVMTVAVGGFLAWRLYGERR